EDSKSAVYYFERKVKECGLSKTATVEIFIPPDQRIDKLIETFLGEDYEKLKSYPQIFQLIKEKGGDEQKAIQYANKLEIFSGKLEDKCNEQIQTKSYPYLLCHNHLNQNHIQRIFFDDLVWG
ncbi:hypothetical protein THIOM_002893, partial [Candidatus Thiomargarita nelsonii]